MTTATLSTDTMSTDSQAQPGTVSNIKTHAARIVRSEAFHAALKELQGLRLTKYADGGNTIHIGTGTKLECRITMDEDGFIRTDNPQLHSMPLRRSNNSFIFSEVARELESQATKAITKHTLRALNMERSNTWTQSYQEIIPHEEIYRAAKAAISTLGNGYVQDPAELGQGLLRQLIGKERISKALSIFGSQATIADLNTLLIHQETLEAARKLNPNATVLWLSWVRDPRNNNWDHTPEQIIEEAREVFISRCEETQREISRKLNAQEAPSPESMWHAFTGLNAQAVNHHPPLANHHHYLSALAAAAGAQPSYSIINHMMKHPNRHMRRHPVSLLITAFQESAARRAKPAQGTQKAIVAILKRQLEQAWNWKDGKQEQINQLAGQSPSAPFSAWEDLLGNQPEQAVNPQPSRAKGYIANSKRPHTRATMEELMAGPRQADFAQAATVNLRLMTVPGHSVHLILARNGQNVVAFHRDPQGRISVTADPELHHADATGLPGPNPKDSIPMAPSTQGIVRAETETALKSLTYLLRKNGDITLSKRTNPATTALRVIEASPDAFGNPDTDQSVTAKLRSAVATLLRPEIVALCHKLAGCVPIDLYNSMLNNRDIYARLLETNPGIAAWCALHEPLNNEPGNKLRDDRAQDHPSRLTAWAKENLTGLGLPKEHWKFVSRMNPETVQGAYRAQRIHCPDKPEHAALLLSAMAASRVELAPEESSHIAENLMSDNPMAGTRFDEHLPYALRLAAAAAARRPEGAEYSLEKDQITSVADYLNHLNRQGQAPTSKTWRGLVKSAERYHREINEQRVREDWERKLRTSNGRHSAWNSLLEEFEHQGFTFTAVNSEKKLYMEGAAMRHCVYGYGTSCAQGRTRIFSLIKDGEHTGTTELASQDKRIWKNVQTRGHMNAELPADAHAAADALAGAYTALARKAAEEDRHRTWTVQEPGFEDEPGFDEEPGGQFDGGELPF